MVAEAVTTTPNLVSVGESLAVYVAALLLGYGLHVYFTLCGVSRLPMPHRGT